uniref:Uncharacterized protein n=1 Tax=Rhizophora mucronata TaxID=61149 RepID=A0A2P2J5E6_RHIMU
MDGAEMSASLLKAVVERTMVAPPPEGLDTEVCARSTILTWTVRPGLVQALGGAALMHLTTYCLLHAAPLSHNPSPAAANRFVVGNCDVSPPKQAVAVIATQKI